MIIFCDSGKNLHYIWLTITLSLPTQRKYLCYRPVTTKLSITRVRRQFTIALPNLCHLRVQF